eukprot:CAMPEP_0183337802 /NCGR_PEP_ID=MMETSP0164_2-20130417/5322_1 /TAXON_ID=221442 /ORGANISM="Coccolithus pelagicus ssp braarudi, Strain PLY182g" /LENGTH=171 /DNA_ID=CAMNT_0025507553 /DNA_START=56 /DNA_END=571 /DNA_ORIENTATION=-
MRLTAVQRRSPRQQVKTHDCVTPMLACHACVHAETQRRCSLRWARGGAAHARGVRATCTAVPTQRTLASSPCADAPPPREAAGGRARCAAMTKCPPLSASQASVSRSHVSGAPTARSGGPWRRCRAPSGSRLRRRGRRRARARDGEMRARGRGGSPTSDRCTARDRPAAEA